MKSKSLFVLSVLFLGVLFIGCANTSTGSITNRNKGSFGEASILPVKDFNGLGIVFTNVTLTTEEKIGVKGVITESKNSGEVFTYQALLQEAKKLNADAIINVTIDTKTETVTTGTNRVITQTYYGSALAIKYTNALTTQIAAEKATVPLTTVNDSPSNPVPSGGSAATTQAKKGFFQRLLGR